MNWSRVIGFGEAMVRLTSPVGTPLAAGTRLDTTVGGAELNAVVAARLAGMPGTWVSALPRGPLADLITRQAAASHVTTTLARSTGTRVGLYFLEARAAPRAGRVTYDRADSAFARLDPTSLDWTELLTADSCLVLSGITPALGTGPRTAMRQAMQMAVDVGATIALDVNFRPSLWGAEECFGLLGELMTDVSVLSASRDDLQGLGIDGDDPFRRAVDKFDLDAVIGTRKTYRGAMVDLEVVAADRTREVCSAASATVVDAVGTGDALFGTFLAALPHNDLDTAAAQALGAAVTAYGTAGDLMTESAWDIEAPAGGIQR